MTFLHYWIMASPRRRRYYIPLFCVYISIKNTCCSHFRSPVITLFREWNIVVPFRPNTTMTLRYMKNELISVLPVTPSNIIRVPIPIPHFVSAKNLSLRFLLEFRLLILTVITGKTGYVRFMGQCYLSLWIIAKKLSLQMFIFIFHICNMGTADNFLTSWSRD